MDERTIHLLSTAFDALEYFEQREDADYNGEHFVPNEEMSLARDLKEAIEPFRKELPESWQSAFDPPSREVNPKSTICRFPKERK